jgi:putative FmdB family regulatory protein
MPFYEYECQACKFYTEVMQKISDAPLTKCPSCGKRKLKKLVSAPVFRLKGGGWYETDFKSDKETKRNLVGSEKEESKAEAKPDTKADSKPDGKDSKDSKPEAKAANESRESKTPEPKDSGARRSASVPAKAARRPARAASKVTRKRRR